MKQINDGIIAFFDGYVKIINTLDKIVCGAYKLADVLSQIDFSCISQNIKDAGERWGNFKWIPNLPNTIMKDIFKNITEEVTKEEADIFMSEKLDEKTEELLFSTIRDYLCDYQRNVVTFDEALQCFRSGLHTSCCVCLFALIDEAFLKAQKIDTCGKKYRSLSNKAAEKFYDENPANHFNFIAVALKTAIVNIFKAGNDFVVSDDDLYRNYISHGMNERKPDKTDCLKLFVILYNVYFAFEHSIYIKEDGES